MPDSQYQFTQATELVELGRLDEALALFQTLLKTDSNNATLWNNIGIIRFRQGEYRDAVNAFSQAADTDPEFTNAFEENLKGTATRNPEKPESEVFFPGPGM